MKYFMQITDYMERNFMPVVFLVGLCCAAMLCVNIAFSMGQGSHRAEIIAECESTYDKALQSILKCEEMR